LLEVHKEEDAAPEQESVHDSQRSQNSATRFRRAKLLEPSIISTMKLIMAGLCCSKYPSFIPTNNLSNMMIRDWSIPSRFCSVDFEFDTDDDADEDVFPEILSTKFEAQGDG
jgi:hypothetical protein